MHRSPIFLLGMMGAGKSSVGRELARRLDAVFIDLDARIELLFGAAIAQLFEDGEEYFRACERAALVSLVDEPGFAGAAAVIATGGGVVTEPANLRTMASVGRTVYLEVDVSSLCARLSTPAQRARRPLLSAAPERLEPRLSALLAAREQAYRKAGSIVDARGEIAEVAARVADLV